MLPLLDATPRRVWRTLNASAKENTFARVSHVVSAIMAHSMACYDTVLYSAPSNGYRNVMPTNEANLAGTVKLLLALSQHALHSQRQF